MHIQSKLRDRTPLITPKTPEDVAAFKRIKLGNDACNQICAMNYCKKELKKNSNCVKESKQQDDDRPMEETEQKTVNAYDGWAEINSEQSHLASSEQHVQLHPCHAHQPKNMKEKEMN